MVIGSFIKSIFQSPRRSVVEDDNAQFKPAVLRAIAIIGVYGNVLVEDEKSGLVRDIKRLPNSKEQIKAAISVLLKVTTDPVMRNHLKTGWTALSAYQPLTPNQKLALEMWDAAISDGPSTEKSRLQKQADLIARSGDVVIPLQKIVADEMEALLQEFNAEVVVNQ